MKHLGNPPDRGNSRCKFLGRECAPPVIRTVRDPCGWSAVCGEGLRGPVGDQPGPGQRVLA